MDDVDDSFSEDDLRVAQEFIGPPSATMVYWSATFMARSRDWRVTVPILGGTFLEAVYDAERFRRERIPYGWLIGVEAKGTF